MALDDGTARKLVKLLQKIEDTTKLEGVAVITRDGVRVACSESANVDADVISTASAAIINTSEATAKQLGHGNLSEIIIKGDYGYLLMTRVDDEHMLVASSKDIVRLGLNLGIMKRYSSTVAELIAQSKAKITPPLVAVSPQPSPPPIREEAVSDRDAIFEALRALGLEDAVTEMQAQGKGKLEKAERI